MPVTPEQMKKRREKCDSCAWYKWCRDKCLAARGEWGYATIRELKKCPQGKWS